MATLSFLQNNGETAASEAESLRDVSPHTDFGAVTRHAVSLAVNPHLAGAIIDLVDAGAKQAEGIGYSSANRDFTSGIAPRVAIDSFYAGVRRTTCQNQRSYGQQ